MKQSVTVSADGTASTTVDYNTVIPHTTKPVNAADIRSVDGERVTLTPGSTAAQKLAVGDVLVVGVGPHTPEGLLRKVTAVHTSSSGVTAVAKPAALRQAVPQGHISMVDVPVVSPEAAMRQERTARHAAFMRTSVTPGGLIGAGTSAGEDPELEADGVGGFTFLYKISEGETHLGADKDDPKRGEGSLQCTGGGSAPLLLDTAFTATRPKMALDTSWDRDRQKGVRWTLTASPTAGLGAESNAVETKCDVRWLYPDRAIRLGVVTVPLGPLVVVITRRARSPACSGWPENPTACPDAATTRAAVVDLDEVTDPEDMLVTGRSCWRDWAVVDWVPGLYADRVSATLFKRKGDSLMPTTTMLGVDGPAGSSHNATCIKVKGMKVPPGLLDYLCPTGSGPFATAVFNPASADVFASGGNGYVPALPDAHLKALHGPLRAVQACGNCGPEGGDGSAQIIMLFYGNRYVGMVKEGAAYSFREVTAQNGTRVNSRVRWATPDDPVCCPSGDEVTYQHTWQNHQLQYTESTSS
ncbi:LppP/LprE family lipoprotein [Streptomyces chartreusis]|uniref:LppP/LprE family lipoprotein n=1 Tax=Streptomyces chartreusis TaxID=1969 RepID=A0A7H8T6T3_STRCX|nr:LppP/LprE family lipoprotein [Streptomyces chartreusis]QKZ17620.1 LppP/LprE family lipoprotein [Streptomyces chartreusis]